MGVSFMRLGIVVTTTINSGIMGFISLGVIYMIIGLVNRDI
jgi:hypothetical protein